MINKNVKISVNHDPFAIILENIFEPQTADQILNEIIANEPNFQDAEIVGDGKNTVNKNIRSNRSAYFDLIYKQDRTKSALLAATTELIQSQLLIDLLNSAPYPLSNYLMTDTHETQVSRYGNTNQKYDWHLDRLGDSRRIVTISMYMHKDPKQFQGGEIVLSNGLLYDEKIYGETSQFRFEPKNNSCVIFNSRTPHCVMPTISPEKFDAGRFSIQMWLGKIPISDDLIREFAKAIRSGLS